MDKRVLSQREHVLLQNSETIKQYPWLERLLSKETRITETSLDSLTPKERDVFTNMIKSIVTNAANEWEGEEIPIDELEHERIKCSLCNTENKWIFVITNRLNKNTLNVGSSCISSFSDITFGKDRKSINEIIKEVKRNKRKAKLIGNIPGVLIIEKWNDYRSPIVLPTSVTANFDKLGDKAKSLYNDYINDKQGDEVSFTSRCYFKKS